MGKDQNALRKVRTGRTFNIPHSPLMPQKSWTLAPSSAFLLNRAKASSTVGALCRSTHYALQRIIMPGEKATWREISIPKRCCRYVAQHSNMRESMPASCAWLAESSLREIKYNDSRFLFFGFYDNPDSAPAAPSASPDPLDPTDVTGQSVRLPLPGLPLSGLSMPGVPPQIHSLTDGRFPYILDGLWSRPDTAFRLCLRVREEHPGTET